MSYSNIMVCWDCYQFHHFGNLGDDVPFWNGDPENVPEDFDLYMNRLIEVQYAVESLGDVSDNTCADHYYGQSCETNDDGENIEPCQWCGSRDDDNGIEEFSWRSCHCCGSNLGGARYRLAVHDKEEA